MIPRRDPKINKNLIWILPGAQPGLQAPLGTPREASQPPPDLFFGAPGTLLDTFLHDFEHQQKNQNEQKQNKTTNARTPS